MEEIIEQLDDMIGELESDDLASILNIVESIQDEMSEDDEAPAITRSLLRAYMAGQATAPQRENDTDLLVGITPEDAATLVAGLLGDGATLTLSVVRDG